MTGAARPLSLIQPVVSKIVSQLELEIGFTLFDHIQEKLTATDEANGLYTEVEKSYTGLKRVVRSVQRIKNRSGVWPVRHRICNDPL